VSVSPVEELRWLEYGQRLVERQRNIAARPGLPSVGESLVVHAVAGGRQASGLDAAVADEIELDGEALSLAGAAEADLHDRFVFAGNRALVREVRVAGEHVVQAGRHPKGEAIAARYRRAVRALLCDG